MSTSALFMMISAWAIIIFFTGRFLYLAMRNKKEQD